MTTPATAEELREAQAKEYGTFVAVEPINIGGARAFNVGDPVPAGHVDSGVVPQDKVAKTSTQAGKAATGQEG